MKIKQAIASIALATAFAATFASAAEYTWTGSVDNDWTNENNWDLGSGTPGTADTALFDTTGAQTFTANNMPDGNVGTFVKLTGSGQVFFDNGGNEFQTDYGFEAQDSVSLTLNSGTRLFPWKQDVDTTVFNEWNSSGTLDTNDGNTHGFKFKNSGVSFRQTAGTVKLQGRNLFQEGTCHYYLDGGTVEAPLTLKDGSNPESSSIYLRGGDWIQSDDMTWGGHSDINIEDGVFTVNGVITFETVDGELNFATGSTGSFVSEHTEADILGFITSENLTVNGAAATADDFSITEDGGITTVALIPEPATFGLLGIFGLVYLLRRKLNS